MLKKYSEILKAIMFLTDISMIVIAWFISHFFRYRLQWQDWVFNEWHQKLYLMPLPVIIVLWALILKYMKLYMPRRGSSLVYEYRDIIKASTIILMLMVLYNFIKRDHPQSRLFIFYFWLTSSFLLMLSRTLVREALRHLRKRGHNLRYILIVGGGKIGRKVAQVVRQNPWYGFKVVGFVDDFLPVGTTVEGNRVMGTGDDIVRLISERTIDQIFIALPFKAFGRITEILKSLEDEMVNIRLVPDIFDLVTLKSSMDDFEGLPLITLTESPVHGLQAIGKRAFDIVFSSLVVTILSPLFVCIAILVKVTSRGPVFYRQKRMGLDGKVFDMLKFRTMTVNAESQSGPVWAKEDDPRKTKVGAVLRKTSLDELPQFLNVLKGDMSVVGPRPERPEFIRQFKTQIPKYMLRHKMKAGITGWAQVNGWRGNTSLAKRIECDISYIENWNLLLDVKIIFFTLFKGLINKNAY